MGANNGFKAAVHESPRQTIINAVDLSTAASNTATSDVVNFEGQNALKGYLYYTGGGAGTLTIAMTEEDPTTPGTFNFGMTAVNANTGLIQPFQLTYVTGSSAHIPFAIPILAHNCKVAVTHSTNTGVVSLVVRNGVVV